MSVITVLDASIKMVLKLFNTNLKQPLIDKNEYQLLFENASTGIFIAQDEMLKIVNPATERIIGYPADILTSKPFTSFIHPDDSAMVVENYLKRLNGEDIEAGYPFRIVSGSGKIIWVEISSTFFIWKNKPASLNYIIDTTERKKAEELIRESEERYRTLVESQLEMVCRWQPDTTLTFVNESYCRLMGKSKDELIGKKWIEYIPESSRPEVFENYKKAVKAKEVYSYIHEVKVEEGIRWYRWNDVPLFNSEGNLHEFQSVGHDITERKHAEDSIKNLLEEKELILKEVHHRVKNNMGTIKALLMLQAESLKESSAVAALHDAGRRVQSMSELYDKLYMAFNFTEMPVSYYMSSLVDEIISNFPNSKSVVLDKKIDDFVLDLKRLQPLGIIINEVLTNIMKYAFIGRESGVINLTASVRDNNVIITIQDNGVGIPESLDFRNSTGFGMQLISMLAAQIGAAIKIETHNGTSFSLEFKV